MYLLSVLQDLLLALQKYGYTTKLMPRKTSVGAIRNYCEPCNSDEWCSEKCIHATADKMKAGKPFGY